MRLDLVELCDKMFAITPCTSVAVGFTYGLVSHLNYWSLIHPTNAVHAATFSGLLGYACAITDWFFTQDEFKHTAKNPSVNYVFAAFGLAEIVKRFPVKIDISLTRGFVVGVLAHLVGWVCIKIHNHYSSPKEPNGGLKTKVNMELDLFKLLEKISDILLRTVAASGFAYGLVSHLNYWSFIHPMNAAHAATFSGLLGLAYAIADWLHNQEVFQNTTKKTGVKCVIAGLGLAGAVHRSWVKIDISPIQGVVIGALAHLVIETCIKIYQRRFPPTESDVSIPTIIDGLNQQELRNQI